MKILVLSLLRIGDIVLASSILRGLRTKYPEASIEVVINSQFKQVSNLMPYVDRWIEFDREALQSSLSLANEPLFDAYHQLSEWMDALGDEPYDLAINLTHNRLSGWMMSLIEAKTRIGLCFDAQGRGTFGSSWFRHLNSQVDAESLETFHFTDIFRFACGLESVPTGASLEPTALGESEAERFLNSAWGMTAAVSEVRPSFLAVQALTSDTKKNWGLARFQMALEVFASRHPQTAIAILGAESERNLLEPIVAHLKEKGIRADLAILSFEGAFSLLRKAKLLLSGDTSIKHLAALAKTTVVELSIGSSDFPRTGAYQHGSVILQSVEACAPCTHSSLCHRDFHACASRLSADVVGMVTSEVFAGRSFQLSNIATEYQDEVSIYRVDIKTCGYWTAVAMTPKFSEENVAIHLDRASRKLWLMALDEREMSYEFGTEIRQIATLMRSMYPTTSPIEWRHLLDAFESQAQATEVRINGFKTGIRVLHGCFESRERLMDFVKGLIGFREKIRHMSSQKSFKTSLDSVIEDDISPPFTRFRRIVDAVNEIEGRTAINLRMLRSLENEMGHEVDQPQRIEIT